MEPPNATTRQVLARRAITSVAATVTTRITTATDTLTLTSRRMFNSPSPPHEKHQPHDQCDHIGKVRVQTARLKSFEAVGHPQHGAQQRTVDVPFEGRLDLRVVAHLVREIWRDVRQR